MGVTEIPRSFGYVCDGCGLKHVQNSTMRPPHWSNLRIDRDAYDYQGNACANGGIQRQLCAKCSEKVYNAVNAALSDTSAA